LGARQDLVRLAARLGQGGKPLLLCALAILASLLGVLEALLDPRLAVAEHLRDGLEGKRPHEREEDGEVRRRHDHLEEVDLEQRFRCAHRDVAPPDGGDEGQKLHDGYSVRDRLSAT